MMADRLAANNVVYMDLISDGNNLMAVPYFHHTMDNVGGKLMHHN